MTAYMLHIEMLQAAVAGIVEENHNEHHLGLGERTGTMIRPFLGILDCIFCHHGTKKLAKISTIQNISIILSSVNIAEIVVNDMIRYYKVTTFSANYQIFR